MTYELDPRTTEVTEISFLLAMGTTYSKGIWGKVSYNLSQGNNFALQLKLGHLRNMGRLERNLSVTNTGSAFSYKSLLPQARSWDYTNACCLPRCCCQSSAFQQCWRSNTDGSSRWSQVGPKEITVPCIPAESSGYLHMGCDPSWGSHISPASQISLLQFITSKFTVMK